MTLQNLDFGTSANNDGESLLAGMTKIEANFTALYAADGTVTHVVTDVASAATCDIGAATTDRVRITGTTTITSLGSSVSKLRFVHFSGALILTHNATSLILPGAANRTTADGDCAIFSSDASGNWRCLSYQDTTGVGDVSGPGSSTDSALALWNGTGGEVLKNSTVTLSSTVLAPTVNDAIALGTTVLGFADLHGATGFTWNIANGNWLATHSSGILTIGTGEVRITTVGTNTASVVTVGGTQTLTAKTLTSPIIGTSPTAAGATWTDLGSVTTADINGGTIDGSIIGGASAAAITGTAIVGNSFVPNLSTVPSNGMYLPAANTLGWAINSAAELQLTATALSPAADGGNSLGTTLLGWQNFFGNTGFVLNIEGGDWVATHTTGILTVGTGDLRVTTAGTNAASVVTLNGTQTLANKTLTTVILGTPASGTLTNCTGLPSIVVANEASDTTSFLLFATAATGELGPRTNANLAFNASTGVLTLTAPILGTPTSGTLTNCTGLPVAGITASTSTALGVGSLDLGHATDTTLSRSAAGVMAVEGINALLANKNDTIVAGFYVTPFSAGTKSSGTFTPDAASGNKQYAVNGGAHTLAPPASASNIELEYTNNASAGAITTSGFTIAKGDAFTTTNGSKFLCYISKSQTYSLLNVVALQ